MKFAKVCPIAFEVRSAWEERREADAKRIAIEHLRRGYCSKLFLEIVADLLEDKKLKKKKYLPKWIEIGQAFEKLRGDGVPYAHRELAKHYRCSETNIRTVVRKYQAAKKEHDAIR